MNKNARAMRDSYGVPYSTALRLIREHGLDGAIEKLEQKSKPAPGRILAEAAEAIAEQKETR